MPLAYLDRATTSAEEDLPNQPHSRHLGTLHSNSTAHNSPPTSKFRDDIRGTFPSRLELQ
ncbi:hypothetical protein BT96DRAFT_914529 [Gymnopus androsaceus JB14]|uniref:Uncharacterized protein n=1 Tax=Gymnopus androsaceus JB14 TaxID=1447944 RepID=A0A6A4I6C4_9AGAR|nr:hypothetical protein BT96DRAFT_914529 [Gymnopus androsaceus JB14]